VEKARIQYTELDPCRIHTAGIGRQEGGNAMIKISDVAAEKIREMLTAEQSPDLFLRIGVKTGGCSGFSYGMSFDDTITEEDKVLEVNGLKVVVDNDSSRYLYGVSIDFKESAMGGGFTIDNPNAVATCGCGQSFRTRDEAGVPEEC
jgi:iron-sulfur cluster assembly protein